MGAGPTMEMLRAHVPKRRRGWPLVGSLAIVIALLAPTAAPRPLQGAEDVTWSGSYSVRWTVAPCNVYLGFGSFEMAGPVTVTFVGGQGPLIVKLRLAGSGTFSERVSCPASDSAATVASTLEYDGGVDLTADPATGRFEADGPLHVRFDARFSDCRDFGRNLESCPIDRHRDVLSIAATYEGVFDAAGSLSGTISGQDRTSEVSGTFSASGPPHASHEPTETGCVRPEGARSDNAASPLAIRGGALLIAGRPRSEEPDCTGVDVKLEHIEVVQVIQDTANSVPLVTFKSTVVRVFVARVDRLEKPVQVRVLLHGKLGGKPFPDSPRVAIWSPTRFPDRRHRGDSVNFLLPRDWTSSGQAVFAASLEILGQSDVNTSDNGGSVAVEFDDRSRLDVAWVPICSGVDERGELTGCPSEALVLGMRDVQPELQVMLPIRDGGVRVYQLPGPPFLWRTPVKTREDEDKLLYYLFTTYEAASALSWQQLRREPDQFVGLFVHQGGPSSGLSHRGYSDATEGPGRVSWVTRGSAISHEIGHNLGLHHVGSDDDQCKTPPRPRDSDKTAIGEFGWDSRIGDVVARETKDVMSYCPPPHWVSPDHYRTLYRSNLSPIERGVASIGAFPAALVGVTADYLLVSGTVRRDGSAAELGRVLRLTSSASYDRAQRGTSGRFCLVQSGGAAARHCFDLTFEHPESDEPLAENGFAVLVPAATDVRRLALTDDGHELAVMTASDAAPVLTATSRAGETWSSPTDLTWAATDADGTTPSVSVFYSDDGGLSWLPFAPDARDSRVRVDPSRLPTGSQHLFRLLASDGLNTSSLDVGPITVSASVGRPAATDAPGTGPGPDSPASPGGSVPWLMIVILVVAGFAGLAGVLLGPAVLGALGRRR